MQDWERRTLAWLEQRRRRLVHEQEEALELLKEFRRERHGPRLMTIKLVFKLHNNHHHPKGECAMAPVQGAVTLNAAGQTATASVLGFDQNGNRMPEGFQMPPVSFEIDNQGVATLTENEDGQTAQVTAVADGSANVKAEVISAEGLNLMDTETVTVDLAPPPPPPTPVLTSIKIAFDVAAPPAETTAPGEATAPAEGEATATATAAPASSLTPNQKLAAAGQGGQAQ